MIESHIMMFIQLVVYTIVIMIFSKNVILTNSKWKNIKKKTKNILLESLNKIHDISQVGPKPGAYNDYPGLNSEKLSKIKKLWGLYYKCLEELEKNTNKYNIFQAKVMTPFRSSSLRYLI